MVIKVYISGMSGSKEVKKRQQRVTMILDSKHIPYTIVDITEPGQEAEKDFMQKNSEHNGATISDQNPRHPLPPQMFNDAEYCGDYDDFDMANEVDNLEVFLKMEAPKPHNEVETNEQTTNDESETKGDRDDDATAARLESATAVEDEKLEEKKLDLVEASMDADDSSHQMQGDEKVEETVEKNDEDKEQTDQTVEEESVEHKDKELSENEAEEPMIVDEESKEPVEATTENATPPQDAEDNEENSRNILTELPSSEASESETKVESVDPITEKHSEETEEPTDAEVDEVTSKTQEGETDCSQSVKEDSEQPMSLDDEDSKLALPVVEADNENIEEEPVENTEENIDKTDQKPVVENEESMSPTTVVEESSPSDEPTADLQPTVESAKDPPPENDEIENEPTMVEAAGGGGEEEDDDDESDSDEPVSVMEVTKAVDDGEATEGQVLDSSVKEETVQETGGDSKETSSDVHGYDEDLAEQRELLKAAAAMGEREDADEEAEEDVEIAEEDDVSGKLVDTDDPMLAEQEQEE
nr:glutamic acid-rich protein isoform X2 [Aedes albopictus]